MSEKKDQLRRTTVSLRKIRVVIEQRFDIKVLPNENLRKDVGQLR